MFSTIIWDPDRNFFVLPYLNHPVTWYGFLFALAFLVSYLLVRKVFTDLLPQFQKKSNESEIRREAVRLTDRLSALVIVGSVIGARLGYVFFYGWPYYRDHLLDIFKTWEGGLASHGGVVGVLIAIVVYLLWQRRHYPPLTFLVLLDLLVMAGALSGGLIRIGNFINQEITGIPTDLPWAVSFMHPANGYPGIPVHPVQLYESLFYFSLFGGLFFLWHKMGKRLGSGLLSGLFFLCLFSFRFVIEFLKVRQSDLLGPNAPLSMGQLLSIPFIFLGVGLVVHASYKLRRQRA